MGKLKNGKAADKDDVIGEMIKSGDDRVVDWIWRLCNMAFERGGVPEDWRSAMIVPLHKVKKRKLNVRIIEVPTSQDHLIASYDPNGSYVRLFFLPAHGY